MRMSGVVVQGVLGPLNKTTGTEACCRGVDLLIPACCNVVILFHLLVPQIKG